MTKPITKIEKAWLKKVEKLLTNPPSERISFYTIGDCGMTAYDNTRDDEINKLQNRRNMDFCSAVDELDAELGNVSAAMNINSTAG